jgi:hypothetical protein
MVKWTSEYIKLYSHPEIPVNTIKSLELKDEHIPQKLYKYCSFGEYTFKNLENNTGYCRDPREFNDLLDTYPIIDVGSIQYNDEKERNNLQNQMKNHFSEEEISNIFGNDNWYDNLLKTIANSK